MSEVVTGQVAQDIKNIILDELRNVGYAPNPKDVTVAVQRIKDHINSLVSAAEAELPVLAAEAGAALDKVAAVGSAAVTQPPVASPAPVVPPVVVPGSSFGSAAPVAPVTPKV